MHLSFHRQEQGLILSSTRQSSKQVLVSRPMPMRMNRNPPISGSDWTLLLVFAHTGLRVLRQSNYSRCGTPLMLVAARTTVLIRLQLRVHRRPRSVESLSSRPFTRVKIAGVVLWRVDTPTTIAQRPKSLRFGRGLRFFVVCPINSHSDTWTNRLGKTAAGKHVCNWMTLACSRPHSTEPLSNETLIALNRKASRTQMLMFSVGSNLSINCSIRRC